jgi:gluconate 2-dehydrogenase gamma chain
MPMGRETDEPSRTLSRRDVFTRVGAGGVAAAVGGAGLGPDHVSHAQSGTTPEPRREALETLTAVECDILEAITARLIPSDENGPGAAEARAAHFIDRSLAGPLRTFRESYAIGLAAIDDHARSSKGAPFTRLSPADQDVVLGDVERNAASGFMPSAAAFFGLVKNHTIQGTFCDPYYGGNFNFIGWDLLGYPGLRMAVTEEDQRLTAPRAVRTSAYDDPMFTAKGGGHGHRP